MKKILFSLLVLASMVACKNKAAEEAALAAAAKATADSVAMVEAAKLNAENIAKAETAATEAADTSMWNSALGKKLKALSVTTPSAQADIDKNVILKYAAKNNLDVKSTKSGLFYLLENPGKGAFAKKEETVTCNYKGYFLDGREFDSSYKNGSPLVYPLQQLVPAWVEAMTSLVRPGGKIKLLVPSALGYGAQGFPGAIPGNTVLAFDMEFIKVGQ